MEKPPEDRRIEMLQLFIDNLITNKTKSYSAETLRIWFNNSIYLCLTGSHNERCGMMDAMKIPSSYDLFRVLNPIKEE